MHDTIDIVDGQGTFYKGQITETKPKRTEFQIIEQHQEAPRDYNIHLAVAPTKRQERMEWLVEKATELGVDHISFIECEHSERTRLRLDRLQRKAISAMKQSLKATLPLIEDVVKFEDFLGLVAPGRRLEASGLWPAQPETNKFLAHQSQNAIPLSKAAKPGASYCVVIGPEGDFSEMELEMAGNAGFQQVTLGESRLRTETAALAALIELRLINE